MLFEGDMMLTEKQLAALKAAFLEPRGDLSRVKNFPNFVFFLLKNQVKAKKAKTNGDYNAIIPEAWGQTN